MSLLNPYLQFRGNAREAMEFYRSVFGGELDVSTFRDFQMPGIDEAEADSVMHSQLTTSAGFVLMGADVPSMMPYVPAAGMTIALSGNEVDELRGYWDRLSEGADVEMPLELAPWGDLYGQLTDKYGISWMASIDVSGQAEG